MNRIAIYVWKIIEKHIDMVLRPEPRATSGVNICRVYHPDVNTFEKLFGLLPKNLPGEDEDEVSVGFHFLNEL